MARKPNTNLRNLIRNIVVERFIQTGQGIAYEDLANELNVPMEATNFELDFLGEEDINNQHPPLDALVVNRQNGIPSPAHFEHKIQINQIKKGETWQDYYNRTITSLAELHGVNLNPDWLRRIQRAFR
jgi:hypothetical protein